MRKAFKIPLIIIGAFFGLVIIGAAIGGSVNPDSTTQGPEPSTTSEAKPVPVQKPTPVTYTGDVKDLLPTTEELPGYWKIKKSFDDQSQNIQEDFDRPTIENMGFATETYIRMPDVDIDKKTVTFELYKIGSAEQAKKIVRDLKYHYDDVGVEMTVDNDFGVCHNIDALYMVATCSYSNIILIAKVDGFFWNSYDGQYEVIIPTLIKLSETTGKQQDWKDAIPQMKSELRGLFLDMPQNLSQLATLR